MEKQLARWFAASDASELHRGVEGRLGPRDAGAPRGWGDLAHKANQRRSSVSLRVRQLGVEMQ